MQIKCSECKYCFQDWQVDEETGEEFDYLYCEKTKEDLYTDTEKESCQYFKKYIPRKYVEKDTECDNCENAMICNKLSDLAFDCTTMNDSKFHVVYKKDYCTKIYGTNAEEILSRRVLGLSDEEIVNSIKRENLKKIVDMAKKHKISIPDYVISMCEELDIEV